MKLLAAKLLLFPLACLVFAEDRVTDEIAALIKRLGDEDRKVREQAAQKLEALDEKALAALVQTTKTHDDPDVRLRAAVVARAIMDRHWGEVQTFGIGAAIKVAPPGLGYWLNRVALTPDGKYAVGAGGGLILYDLESGKEVRRTLEIPGARTGLALAADGRSCLTGCAGDTAVDLVEVPSFKSIHRLAGANKPVLAVALAPEGHLAAASDGTGQILLWDTRTGKEVRRMAGVRGAAYSLSFAPDGKFLLSGHQADATAPMVRLWDVEAGKEVRGFDGHSRAATVTGVAVLPGGTRGLSGSLDGTLRLWDLKTGKELLLMRHPGGVYDVAVTRDGKRALSAGYGDNTVRLWDLETGKELHAFAGHVCHVLGVGFSADGRRAVSSDAVCAGRVWRVGK
jgi:WD40 repeat protein